MKPVHGWDGPPTPEQLAAYADGELDGPDALSPLRSKVEAWLALHPEARAELEAQRHLRRIWDVTTPPEPSEEAWRRLLQRMPAEPLPVPSTPGKRGYVRAGWVAAAAAAVGLFFVFRPAPPPPVPAEDKSLVAELDDGAPFEVATADEIEILSVAGADTHSLAVRGISVRDLLQLLGPGEMTLMRPATDAAIQVRNDGQTAPVVWARTDLEMFDD